MPATFTILGSSSGLPQASRSTAGYLLKHNGRLSVFDIGGGVTSSFLKRGHDPLLVDRIFISHTHPDHVCELPLFLQLIYLKGRQESVELYLPEEFVEPFKNYIAALYLIPEKLTYDLEIKGYRPGTIFDDSFKIDAIANTHLHSYAELIEKLKLPNKMSCCSFIIECDRQRLMYSADIGCLDDIAEQASRCNIVVIESTHIDLDQFFQFAADSAVERLILTHLGDADEIRELNQMREKYGADNVTIAVDGLEIDF
jgi:ribonuclease BN (tRNA processing enzyme)